MSDLTEVDDTYILLFLAKSLRHGYDLTFCAS